MSKVNTRNTKATKLGRSFYMPSNALVQLTEGFSLRSDKNSAVIEFNFEGIEEPSFIVMSKDTLAKLKSQSGRIKVSVTSIQEYRKSIR